MILLFKASENPFPDIDTVLHLFLCCCDKDAHQNQIHASIRTQIKKLLKAKKLIELGGMLEQVSTLA